MTTKIQTMIEESREMSTGERLELIREVARTLPTGHPQDYRRPGTLEELALSQEVSPVEDLRDLAVDFWPEEESADELVEYVYRQRQEDRTQD